MTQPRRIRLSRTKGWRMPENTVKVDRTTRWGNPFNLKAAEHCWTALACGCKGDPAGRQAASVILFREWIEEGKACTIQDCGLYIQTVEKCTPLSTSPAIDAPPPPSLAEIREHLRGRNLACWCKIGDPCHADVLLELANG